MNKQEIITIPSVEYFGTWEDLQGFLESRGNPPWRYDSNLNLRYSKITSLGNLRSVGGYLNLYNSKITSLGELRSVGGWLDLYNSKITSLGNLQSVGGDLNLRDSKITSLGELRSVGGSLNLGRTPLAKKYHNTQQIRTLVWVGGFISLG